MSPEVHQTVRWAIWNRKDRFFCGRFCLPEGTMDDPAIPTFETKKSCLRAIGLMNSYKDESYPRRVTVTVMGLS